MVEGQIIQKLANKTHCMICSLLVCLQPLCLNIWTLPMKICWHLLCIQFQLIWNCFIIVSDTWQFCLFYSKRVYVHSKLVWINFFWWTNEKDWKINEGVLNSANFRTIFVFTARLLDTVCACWRTDSVSEFANQQWERGGLEFPIWSF